MAYSYLGEWYQDTHFMIILFGLCALAVTFLYGIWKGYKEKRLKYAVKRQVNALRYPFTMVWIEYLVMLSMLPLVSLMEWVQKTRTIQSTFMGFVIITAAPFVYLFTVVCIALWLIGESSKPLLKYNEQEKVWCKEAIEKNRGFVKSVVRRLLAWRQDEHGI